MVQSMPSNELPNWLEPNWQQIAQQLSLGRFGQTQLINGDLGVGKLLLAKQLAQRLLCQSPQLYACGHCHSCAMFTANTHGDFFEIDDSRGLGVDTIREVNRWATESTRHGVGKVALIHGVDRLNLNAANALLKTLEEPHQATYFLLLKETQASLLATIASRCQVIRLPAPQPDIAMTWLQAQLPDTPPKLLEQAWYTLEQGPLAVMAFIEDGGEARLSAFNQALGHFTSGDFQPLLTLLDKDRETLNWFCQLLIKALRQRRLGSAPPVAALSQFNQEQLEQAYEGVIELRRNLALTPGLNFALQIYRALHPLFAVNI